MFLLIKFSVHCIIKDLMICTFKRDIIIKNILGIVYEKQSNVLKIFNVQRLKNFVSLK